MNEKLYTQAELFSAVEREVNLQRMIDMDRRIGDNDQKVTFALGEIKVQIKAVMEMIEKQSKAQVITQEEFKEEIERDFATKADLKMVETKLDGLTLKIMVVVGTITAVGLFAKWLIEFIQVAGKVI